MGKAPNVEDFIAHESFLTSRSEFFRRAMNGRWTEATTRIINLPEDEPDIFALYISYVYTGEFPVASKTAEELKKLEDGDLKKYLQEKHHAIFSVFILAEKFQDVATKNAMLSASLAATRLKGPRGKWFVPSANTTKAIYEGTPSNSPARRFVTDLWTAVSITCIFDQFPKFHKDFAKDLGESIQKARVENLGNIPAKKGIATYHEDIEEN